MPTDTQDHDARGDEYEVKDFCCTIPYPHASTAIDGVFKRIEITPPFFALAGETILLRVKSCTLMPDASLLPTPDPQIDGSLNPILMTFSFTNGLHTSKQDVYYEDLKQASSPQILADQINFFIIMLLNKAGTYAEGSDLRCKFYPDENIFKYEPTVWVTHSKFSINIGSFTPAHYILGMDNTSPYTLTELDEYIFSGPVRFIPTALINVRVKELEGHGIVKLSMAGDDVPGCNDIAAQFAHPPTISDPTIKFVNEAGDIGYRLPQAHGTVSTLTVAVVPDVRPRSSYLFKTCSLQFRLSKYKDKYKTLSIQNSMNLNQALPQIPQIPMPQISNNMTEKEKLIAYLKSKQKA